MKLIYIAGKLNDTAVEYIKNLHNMIRTANYVRKLGFSVYIPCLDILSGLVEGDMEYHDYFSNNMPWLAQADAILVLPNWETSIGTKTEIEYAEKLNIPVYYSIPALLRDRE